MRKSLRESTSLLKSEDFDLEKFEFVKHIGEGGFGEVELYKYRGKEYILKLLYKNKMKEAYGVESDEVFKNEVKIMTEIGRDCENSVKIYDFYENEKQYIFLLEVCNQNLQEYVIEKYGSCGIGEDEIKNLLTQLNNVFRRMLDSKIIHRDIKPQNILVKKIDGKIIFKLSDYGLSKKLHYDSTKTSVGTPGFAAPEVILEKSYDNKIDIFELGSTIYFLLYNKFPYQESKIIDIYGYFKKYFDEDSDSTSLNINSCNPYLNDLLKKMLIINPKKRLSWEDYFNHNFFHKTVEFIKPEDVRKYDSKKTPVVFGSHAHIEKDKKDEDVRKYDSKKTPVVFGSHAHMEKDKKDDIDKELGRKRPRDEKDDHDIVVKRSKIVTPPKRKLNLLFMIDSTGSMQPSIDMVKNYCKDLSEVLNDKLPRYEIRYGAVCYRDPVDCFDDIHQKIEFTSNINNFRSKIEEIVADGGADLCEDWFGAYTMALYDMDWKSEEGNKNIIIHITDAPAHGIEFTSYDLHYNEGKKLLNLMETISIRKFIIIGYYINNGESNDTKNCFNECRKIFYKKGNQCFEIEEFDPKKTDPKYFKVKLYTSISHFTFR